jgi:enamine deaminase RidA (YjgF/YER057c/UK114 family)
LDFGLALDAGLRASLPRFKILESLIQNLKSEMELMEFINPETLGAPRGYSNGVAAPPGGRLLFIAGQIAWDERQRIASADFAGQFERALANLLAVVREAGGTPQEIARLVIYVTDKKEYIAARPEVGRRWRALMGRHFPAMVLVEVKGLLEDDAKVEIEGIAVLQK